MDKERSSKKEVITKHPLDELSELFNSAASAVSNQPKEVRLQRTPPKIDADYGVHAAQVSPDRRTVVETASNLKTEIEQRDSEIVQSVVQVGPNVNVKLDMNRFGTRLTQNVLEKGAGYGSENIGQGETVFIDMSSPNIAKQMSVGHLRSTIIGDALSNIHKNFGYRVIKDNHIGDWGTQFGKLITAVNNWSSEDEILESEEPIEKLQELYVEFHDKSERETQEKRQALKTSVQETGLEQHPELKQAISDVKEDLMTRKNIPESELNMDTIMEDALDVVVESDLEQTARANFSRLERGDPNARNLWKTIRDVSLQEFNKIYKILDVEFDEALGESHYEGDLPDVISSLENSQIAEVDEGALIVDLSDKKLGVAVIQKSDGASVYMTRDLATARQRQERGADKILYVVGDDQTHYFNQLFEILRRSGDEISEGCMHVPFGMVKLPEGKMSTRKGRVVLLKDLIKEGISRVDNYLSESNPQLHANPKKREQAVNDIAIGALKWNDLSQDTGRTITFNWDDALNMDGYSGPYAQYSAVRANSLLSKASDEKAEQQPKSSAQYTFEEGSNHERQLLLELAEYPNSLKEALKTNNPSKVARKVFEIAQEFNRFYGSTKVIGSSPDSVEQSRLNLVASTSQVIENGLKLLGINVPEEM